MYKYKGFAYLIKIYNYSIKIYILSQSVSPMMSEIIPHFMLSKIGSDK